MILDKINSLDLANKFVREKDKPWIIFAGSAISYKDPSNLPSVKMIKSILVERLAYYGSSKLNKNYKNKVLEYKDYLVDGKYSSIFSEIPFETFMSFFYRSIANFSYFILDLYGIGANKLYNINHNIIALLVREGFVRQVITTNYDLLLEEAFKVCFRSNCETFLIQNIKKGEIEDLISNTALSKNLKKKPIVKLHGCCSVEKTIVFTEESIDRWRESISYILPLLLDKANIVFIGYSGRDEIDIMPIIRELSINERITVYWLTRPEGKEENLPKDLDIIQVIHDLDNSSGNNVNALIAIAKKIGIFSEIKIPPKKNFERSINPAEKVSLAIDEIFKREKHPDITSLKILTSIFEHLKIGDIALNLASIAKSIDEGSFSA
ncbi:MAG: SIR2 family protein, partial [Actinobacteria bacterium]|nr:SIR2 family protein [Actinomycetota bacterium]